MNRLFLRIYLGVLAAAILGLAMAANLAHVPYDQELLESHSEYVDLIHPQLASELSNSPKENWSEVIAWWEEIAEYEIQIRPRDELFWATQDEYQPPLDEPVDTVSTSFRTDEYWGARPVADSNLVIYYYLWDPFSMPYMATVALGYVITFSIMAGATYVLLRPVIRSTHDLTSTVQAYAEGNLDARVPVPKGTGPLSQLSTQFNRMAAEIQHKMQEQEVMTTAISHELKTPLTRLRLALDMALATGDESKRNDMLTTMDIGLDDLDELTAELLTLAKLSYSDEPLELQPVALSEIFGRLIPGLRDLDPHVKLTLNGAVHAECLGHEDHLVRAFSNLLINGKRYATAAVDIAFMEHEHEVIIWVDDDGAGIPRERREEVFMPFSRLDKSRNRETGGFGLGLAVAKRSLEVQGGTIHIEDSPTGGARFVVRLPRFA